MVFLGCPWFSLFLFAFFAFFAFSPVRPWRREGWRSATARTGENAKKAKKAKKTKKTNDILRKPCEKAANTKEKQGFGKLMLTKPVKTQSFVTSMSQNHVFSQVQLLSGVQNFCFP